MVMVMDAMMMPVSADSVGSCNWRRMNLVRRDYVPVGKNRTSAAVERDQPLEWPRFRRRIHLGGSDGSVLRGRSRIVGNGGIVRQRNGPSVRAELSVRQHRQGIVHTRDFASAFGPRRRNISRK